MVTVDFLRRFILFCWGLSNSSAPADQHSPPQNERLANATLQVFPSADSKPDVPDSVFWEVRLLQASAEQHLRKEKYEEVLVETELILRLDPRNERAMATKALAHLRLKEYDQALSHAEEALSVGESCRDVSHYVIACVLSDDDEYSDAIFHYGESILALKSDSGLLEAHLPYAHRAKAQLEMEDYEAALSDAKVALSYEPTMHVLNGICFVALSNLNRTQEALVEAEVFLKSTPEQSTEINRQIALMHRKAGEFQQAEERFSIAIETLPVGDEKELPSLLLGRARMRLIIGDYDGALVDLTDHITHQPDMARARLLRFFLLMELREPHNAAVDIQFLTETSPFSPILALLYADVYRQMHDFNTAHESAERAASLAGGKTDTFVANIVLGDLLATTPVETLRDGKRALRLSKAACETANWRYELALQAYAAACAEVGDFEEAIYWQGRTLVKIKEHQKDPKVGRFHLLRASVLSFDVKLGRFRYVKFTDEYEALRRLECYKQHRPYRSVMQPE